MMEQAPIRVLVADSDQSTRKDLTWHLQDVGFEVVPAASGGEVLMQCEIDPPDVVIIDVRLPDIDGYDVCSQLRHEPGTSNVPIILTTAAVDEMTQSYLGQMVEYAGGDFFVAKPCDVNVLVQLVTDAISSLAKPDEAAPTGFPTRVTWPTTVRARSLTAY